MTKRQKILIVGGGSAGWLTAHLLWAELVKPGRKPVDIAVVEPSDIGRIGVGEATLPSLAATLQRIGLSEREFLRRTHASFKHSIRFVDWRAGGKIPNDAYYHTFEHNEVTRFARFSPFHGAWARDLKRAVNLGEVQRVLPPERLASEYSRYSSVQAYLCDRRISPKSGDMDDWDGVTKYAYHLDAEALGDWLREVGAERGIARIDDAIVDVSRAQNGTIARQSRVCARFQRPKTRFQRDPGLCNAVS